MITVIIPVFNKEHHIEKTLLSLEAQTNKSFEILIIDDASTDKSLQKVQRFSETHTDLDIRVEVNEKNRGVSYSRNKGILMSKKDYVVFLDADDELSPRAIDTYTQIIEKNNHIDFLVSNFNINKDGNLRKNKNFSIRKDPLMAYLNRKLILHTNGWCIKREYLMDNAVYFDEELSWGEDVLFFSEVFLHNGEHILIEDYLSTHYAGVKDSLSENTLSKIDEDILWLNKLSQIIEQTKKDSDHYLSLIKGYRIPGVIIYRLLFNIDRDYDKTMYYYQKYKNNLNYLPIVNGLRSIKLKIKYLELKFRIAFKKVSKKKSV